MEKYAIVFLGKDNVYYFVLPNGGITSVFIPHVLYNTEEEAREVADKSIYPTEIVEYEL
jgi:hypothetical protein